MKKYFPFEEKAKDDENKQPTRRELSKYIGLEKQKVYYNILIINFFIELLLVSFITLFIVKHVTDEHTATLEPFVSGVKLQEWLNLSNLLSLASLLIGIYAITIPIQNKIFKEAKEKKACLEKD